MSFVRRFSTLSMAEVLKADSCWGLERSLALLFGTETLGSMCPPLEGPISVNWCLSGMRIAILPTGPRAPSKLFGTKCLKGSKTEHQTYPGAKERLWPWLLEIIGS